MKNPPAPEGEQPTTPPADPAAAGAPPAAPPPQTPAQPAQPATKAPENIDPEDENGDWIEKANLTDEQKKFMRRTLAQNKSRKEKLNEATEKLTAREKADQEAQRKKDEEDGNYKKISSELESKLSSRDERLKRAEVRNAAIKAGIVDPSIIDVLPLDGVEINDQGDVTGAEKFATALKKNRAYLFGAASDNTPQGTTTTTPVPTPSSSAGVKDAMLMTDEEFRKEKAKIK